MFLKSKINDHNHILLPFEIQHIRCFFLNSTIIIIYHSQTALISFQSGHDRQKYKIFSREDLTHLISVLLNSINARLLTLFEFLRGRLVALCWSQINLLTRYERENIWMYLKDLFMAIKCETWFMLKIEEAFEDWTLQKSGENN